MAVPDTGAPCPFFPPPLPAARYFVHSDAGIWRTPAALAKFVLHVCHISPVTHRSMGPYTGQEDVPHEDVSRGLENMHYNNLADKGSGIHIARQYNRTCSTCCTSNTRGAKLVGVQTNGGRVQLHTTCLQRAAPVHRVHVPMKQHAHIGQCVANSARARGACQCSMRM